MTKLVKITGTKLADVLNGSGLSEKIKGKAGTDVINGGGGNDKIKGGNGNDLITGGQGNDTIDGGKGIDTAVYQGLYEQYVLAFSRNGDLNGTVTDRVANRDGTDTLKKVEFLQFQDAIYDVERDVVFVLNHAPVVANAIADQSVLEDHAVAFTVPANAFTDADNDTLTYTAALAGGGALPGWLQFNAGTRSFSGTPPQDFTGLLDIRVTASDGSASASDVFRLTITPVNDAPIAAGDSASGNEDTPITTANVLANDTDVDNTLTAASISAFTQGAHGTVAKNGNGTFTYTPDLNFSGPDSFTYTIADSEFTSTATVNITVNPVNDAPVANNDSASGNEDTPITTGNVLINDTDVDNTLTAASITAFTQGTHGTVANSGNGTFTYTPALNFNNTDTFTYTITDGALVSTATVNITVNPVNDAPVANDDSASGDEDTPIITGNVLANDIDVDNTLTAASISGFTQGTHGSVAKNGNGKFTYTPELDFNGTDSFTYTISDGLLTSTATVNVTVNPVNDAPVANDDSASGAEDTPITTGNVLANDIDVDNTLTGASITSFTQGVHGTVVNNGNGTFTYTPGLNFNGPDSFDYTISDGEFTSTATVDITVTPANDAPTVLASPFKRTVLETAAVQTLTSSFLLGAIGAADVDGDTLKIVNPHLFGPDGSEVPLNSLPPGVNVSFAPDGSFDAFSFDPAGFSFLPANISVTVTLEFDVSDGHGGLVHDAAQVTITGVNNPAVIGIPNFRDVTEDLSVLNGDPLGALTAGGNIPISDPDDGQSAFNTNTFTPGTLGALFLQSNGSYTYVVPNPFTQFLGANDTRFDNFTIRSVDGTSKTVTFAIHGRNDPVVIQPPFNPEHSFFDQMGTPSPASGLTLANNIAFSDADVSDHHTVSSVFVPGSDPQIGSLSASLLNDTTNGTGGLAHWEYHLNAGAIDFLGANEHRLEMFRVVIDDGHGGGASPTLFFDIAGANDAPVMQGQTNFNLSLQAPVATGPILFSNSVSFSDVDVNDHHFVNPFFNPVLSGAPTPLGTLFTTLSNGTTNGTGGLLQFSYIVDPALVNTVPFGGVRTDAFDVVLDDGNGGTAQAHVFVSISGANTPPGGGGGGGNQAPVAIPDIYSVSEGSPIIATHLTVNAANGVLRTGTPGGDFDPDGNALTAVLVSGPSHAQSFQFNADGSFSYSPEPYFVSYTTPAQQLIQSDTFVYRAFDGTAYSADTTVTINVTPPTHVHVNPHGYDMQGGASAALEPMAKFYDDLALGNPVFTPGINTALPIPPQNGFTVTTSTGITYTASGENLTYAGGVPTGGTFSSLEIKGVPGFPQIVLMNASTGVEAPWKVSAAAFYQALQTYAAPAHDRSGLDAIFQTVRYDNIDAAQAVHSVIVGGAFDDELRGAAGPDTLYGGLGDDVLSGGADGGDISTGGPGADRYEFGGQDGHDFVTDFSGVVGGDHDVLDVRAFIGPGPSQVAHTFAQVMSNTHQLGSDTVINYTSALGLLTPSVITLQNFAIGDLRAEDFLYANFAPTAAGDNVSATEGVLTLIDVLANDGDGDGDAISLAGVSAMPSGPFSSSTQTFSGATISVSGGQVLYDPTSAPILSTLAPGSHMFDNFSYTVSDGLGGFATAVVNVDIVGV